MFLGTKTLVSLSEQELVDCSGAEGNHGCDGGAMQDGFRYIETKGICAEHAYPYKAKGGACEASKCTKVAHIGGFKGVAAHSENALLTAISERPVSVAIEADQNSFQHYSSGVMTAACGAKLDHGVLAVGYGVENGKDYYKVRAHGGGRAFAWCSHLTRRILSAQRRTHLAMAGMGSSPPFYYYPSPPPSLPVWAHFLFPSPPSI